GYGGLVAFSPDGKTLLGTEKTSVRFWDVTRGKLKREVKGPGGPSAYSPEGKYLVWHEEKTTRLLAADTLEEVRRFRDYPRYLSAITFSADGKCLATADRNTVSLWDISTGKQTNLIPGHQGDVVSVAFAPDGKGVASGSADGTTHVWDLAS